MRSGNKIIGKRIIGNTVYELLDIFIYFGGGKESHHYNINKRQKYKTRLCTILVTENFDNCKQAKKWFNEWVDKLVVDTI